MSPVADHSNTSSAQIARILWKEKIPTPTAHLQALGQKTRKKLSADPYCWQDTTIDGILGRMEYTGAMVNSKYYKKSYKKKRSYKNAPDKSGGKRVQQIDIYYNAVGVIDIPTPKEMDILRTAHIAQKHKSA